MISSSNVNKSAIRARKGRETMNDVGTQTERDNKAVIRKAFDDWAAGTGGVFSLLTEDATWKIVGNSPVSRTYNSRKEFMDFVIDPFNDRMSARLVPTLLGLYADGDMVIAYFDASATAKDGKPYDNTYTWYLQMNNGRVVNAIAFFDTLEFTDFWNRVSPTC
jgi:ketosteroid isomerase-like protein